MNELEDLEKEIADSQRKLSDLRRKFTDEETILIGLKIKRDVLKEKLRRYNENLLINW